VLNTAGQYILQNREHGQIPLQQKQKDSNLLVVVMTGLESIAGTPDMNLTPRSPPDVFSPHAKSVISLLPPNEFGPSLVRYDANARSRDAQVRTEIILYLVDLIWQTSIRALEINVSDSLHLAKIPDRRMPSQGRLDGICSPRCSRRWLRQGIPRREYQEQQVPVQIL